MVNTGCNRSPIEIYASPYCNRSEEHTSELHHGYISYAVFCLKKKKHLDDVITDSDVSNAIQYSSELNSALQTMSDLVQMAIAFSIVPFLNAFVQNTVNNVNQHLTAAVTTATALDALLSGLGSGYATQASEAGPLLSAC